MAERTLRLTVAASADRSLTSVIQPLVDSFERAKTKVAAGSKSMSDSMKGAAKDGADHLGKGFDLAAARGQKAYKQIEEASAKAAVKEAADAAKSAQAKVIAEQKAFDERIKLAQKAATQKAAIAKREHDAEEKQILQDVRRHEAAEERKAAATARADARAAKRDQRQAQATSERNMGGIARDAGSTVMRLGRAAMGAAGSIASGMGVNFDMGSSMARGIAVQSRITDIVNQAILGGQDPGAGARKRLAGVTRNVANENAVSAGSVASVLGSFQAKSSDMAGGEVVVGRLAKLSKATGTELANMGDAAGWVNAQLIKMSEFSGNTEKRMNVLSSVMRHVTKQTADGSVEMSDYAIQMGKIVAAANRYGGSFEENVGQLGALSQMSMRGGASSAVEAARSAASFSRDLTKGKTLDKWKEAKIDIFADKDKTKLKSPEQIIVAYLEKFGANQEKLAEFFPNDVSKKGVMASMNIFADAGGTKDVKKGIAAVHEEWNKFAATISEEDVDKLASTKMGDTDSKAQLFQNRLDEIAASLAERLLPAMESLAPKALAVADAMATLASFMAANAGTTVLLAITGSIAKAMIGNTVGELLKNLITKAVGSGVSGMGGLGLTLGAVTMGVTAATIYATHLDQKTKEGYENEKGSIGITEDALKKAKAEFDKTGTLSPSTVETLQSLKKENDERTANARAEKISNFDVLLPKALGGSTAEEQGKQQADKQSDQLLNYQGKDIESLLSAVKEAGKPQGVQVVRVENMPNNGLVSSEGVEGIPPE